MGRKRNTFRISCKHLALTWSDFSHEKPSDEKLNEIINRFKPDRWAIAPEQHENGIWHIHSYMCFENGFETCNARFFDFDDKHPNFKACEKGKQQGWINYVAKGEFTIFHLCEKKDCAKACDAKRPWANFRREQADKEAHHEWCEAQARGQISWPLQLSMGGAAYSIPLPTRTAKKRHHIFVGPSDLGKTRALQSALKGLLSYWPPNQALYRWEAYAGEQIIVYDDWWPPRSELIHACEVHEVRQQVCGGSRYVRKWWPLDIVRVVIVLLNSLPVIDDAIAARFNIHELQNLKE